MRAEQRVSALRYNQLAVSTAFRGPGERSHLARTLERVMTTLEPPGIRGMSVNTRITKMRNIRLWSLVLFCGFFLFTSSIRAQCTPVVYAFRHAEDVAIGTALTRVGVQHADLYPLMVGKFDDAHNYCPVEWVYSMYDINPDGSPGTTNPFQTAEPLAFDACIVRAGVPVRGDSMLNGF